MQGSGFTWHKLLEGFTIELCGELELDDALEREVDAAWHAAREAKPGLFDGPLFTMVQIQPERILAKAARYRHLIASRSVPALRAAIDLRPLAVTGVISCPDGLILGLRSDAVAHDSGLWELAPSGSLEAACTEPRFDAVRDALREAREELGLAAADLSAMPPTLLLENGATGIAECIVRMSTQLGVDALRDRHAAHGTDEYSAILALGHDSAVPADLDLLPETAETLARVR